MSTLIESPYIVKELLPEQVAISAWRSNVSTSDGVLCTISDNASVDDSLKYLAKILVTSYIESKQNYGTKQIK